MEMETTSKDSSKKTQISQDELDIIIKGVLTRVILDNSRLKDILASELLRATGYISLDRIDEARAHLLSRVGLGDFI